MGGQERGISPFPLTSISSPFYQSLISQTLTPDSSAHLVASSEDRWKASAQLEGEEDCEVLTTMGLIHQACICTNLCLRTNHEVECNLVSHWDNK